MDTYDSLETEFLKKVKHLQSKCKHEKTTWCEQHWALGHSSGYKVEICDICNKRINESPTKKERELSKTNFCKEMQKKYKGQEIKEI